MTTYIHRVLEDKLKLFLEIFPVVGITGPRQSGKSTMLKSVLKDTYTYVTFDDFRYVNLFHEDPEKFITEFSNKVIFDEIQKVPELFHYIKRMVDEDRSNYGRFIVTGSAQFSLMASLTESMAGRIGLLTLLPFQYSEVMETQSEPSEFLGSYPEVVLKNYQNAEYWYNAYLETYLEKDVRTILNIGNLSDFRRLIKLLAAQCAQIVNYSTIAKSLGVAVNTVKRWMSVLEASYIIFILPPFYDNLSKRIIKSGKVYFYDTGLISALTGLQNKKMYEDGPLAGPLFENYVISEIKKRSIHTASGSRFYYYRTSNKTEVDLIIENGLKKSLIEIKKSKTFKSQMVKPIESIMLEGEEGFLLYNGDVIPYSKTINVWPYSKFLT